jgi:ferredoxin-thioredoxin reductase catalytic subunit
MLKAIVLCFMVALCDNAHSFTAPFVPSCGGRRSTLTLSVVKEIPPEEKVIALEKATKAMTAFTNKYLDNTGTKLCADKSVAAVVIKGLAEHKVTLGAPLCPCRFYDDKEAEAKDGFWNCPCVPMRERHECHCMLFLTDDNQFAGTETNIEYEEVIQLAKGLDTM